MKHVNNYFPGWMINGVIAHLRKTKGYISIENALSMGTTQKEYYKLSMGLLDSWGVVL